LHNSSISSRDILVVVVIVVVVSPDLDIRSAIYLGRAKFAHIWDAAKTIRDHFGPYSWLQRETNAFRRKNLFSANDTGKGNQMMFFETKALSKNLWAWASPGMMRPKYDTPSTASSCPKRRLE